MNYVQKYFVSYYYRFPGSGMGGFGSRVITFPTKIDHEEHLKDVSQVIGRSLSDRSGGMEVETTIMNYVWMGKTFDDISDLNVN